MRRAAHRDSNEGEIRARFEHHGWHVESVNQEGKWDLDCYPPGGPGWRMVVHVDAKMPDGRIELAQVEKWTALHALRIPVYIARSEADVDAIVSCSAEPWSPEAPGRVRDARKGRAFRPGTDKARSVSEMCKADFCTTSALPGTKPLRCAKHAPTPRGSRSSTMATKALEPSNAAEHRAIRAAVEAGETFAPAPVPPCGHCGDVYRPACFDPKAPPGSVKCRKDVHCYRYDGHDGECSAHGPRACTT